MKKIVMFGWNRPLLIVGMLFVVFSSQLYATGVTHGSVPSSGAILGPEAVQVADISRADLYIRDPYIVPDANTQTYYLYKSSRVTLTNGDKRPGVVAYTSKDLQTWHGPYPVFHYPDGFWANGSIWAPEVNPYKGKYYLFATFNSDKPIILPEGRSLSP